MQLITLKVPPTKAGKYLFRVKGKPYWTKCDVKAREDGSLYASVSKYRKFDACQFENYEWARHIDSPQ